MMLSMSFLRPLDHAFVAMLARLCPQADATALALAGLMSWQHGQGHLRLSLTDLTAASQCWDLSDSERHELQWLLDQSTKRLHDSLRGSGFVAVAMAEEAPHQPLVLDDDGLYLLRAWRDECFVARQLSQRIQGAEQPATALSDDLVAVLDQLFPPTDETDWQRKACELALLQPFSVIAGGPGTGKTTTVVKLLGLLQYVAMAGGQPLAIALAAPTGKAAARLNESIRGAVEQLPLAPEIRAHIPLHVSTVHRLLGAQGQGRSFRHHQHNPLLLDVLVIDEASMLDLSLFSAVLAALPAHARLILLGDKDQLASVEAGAVLGDLCAGMDQQVLMLRKSHRFDGQSGIGRLAQDVRSGQVGPLGDYAPDVVECGQHELFAGYRDYWQRVHQPPDYSPEAWQQWALQVTGAFEAYRVLAAVRDGEQGVAGLNQLCLQQLCHGQALPDTLWYVGRPIMVTRNDYSLGLMNGDVGITLWLPDENTGQRRLRVVFRSNEAPNQLRWILPSRLPEHEMVFAMTVHKSQGSEFDQVAFVLPSHDVAVLTRELVYTAVTRPKRRLHLCLSSDMWQLALNRNTIRTSGLRKRLGVAHQQHK